MREYLTAEQAGHPVGSYEYYEFAVDHGYFGVENGTELSFRGV